MEAQNLVDAPGQREASAAVAEFLEQAMARLILYSEDRRTRVIKVP